MAFQPSTPHRCAVIFLHNAKCQPLSTSEVYTRALNDSGLACVCPYGGSSWWSDRVDQTLDPVRTAERYLLDDVVPYVEREWHTGARGVGLLGISMGGQGALRLAFKRPDRFPAVAAVAPAIEHHEYYGRGSVIDALYTSKEQCRQDTVPMHLNPSSWPPHIYYCCDPDDADWIRGCERLHEKMLALGVPHDADLTTRAGGHTWDYFNVQARAAVTFLARGLDHESRRLL